MLCSIGSSWLSEAVRPPRNQVSWATPSVAAVGEHQLDRIVGQLLDDGDVGDGVVRGDGRLVGLGERRRVMLGVGAVTMPVAAPTSRSAQVRAASVSNPWIRIRLASDMSTGAVAACSSGQPDHEMH